ncbi:uncharacterized protein LOC143284315 [Babylonia areolata]|uniref:uncharacterized protein LOC143284315 n=1 Tax=Babylonia areolata TaxID=304850 RepID=UPI003FD0DC49
MRRWRSDPETGLRKSEDKRRAMDEQHATKENGTVHQLTLTRKLMLCAQFMGMEAIANFQQIYTVPVLQTLGMPLSLSFIAGLVSGPSSILILPVFGWLIDRGSNPQRRKYASLLLAAGVQTLGMLCFLVANGVHLIHLMNYNGTVGNETGSDDAPTASFLSDSVGNLSASELGKEPGGSGQDWNSYGVFTESEGTSSAANGSGKVLDSDGPTVPAKAALGMLGFILMDLGFDFSNCFVKALLVTCSARAEHTSLMTTAVVMGAVGGVINAALGAVNLPLLLGLSSIHGAKLTIQSSVQGIVLVLLVVLGFLSTLISSRKQLRQLQVNQSESISTKHRETTKNRTGGKGLPENGSATHEDIVSSASDGAPHTNHPMGDISENSPRPFAEGSNCLGQSVNLEEEEEVEEDLSSMAEDRPLLEDDIVGEEEVDGDRGTSLSGYGATESAEHGHRRTSVEKPAGDAGGLMNSGKAESGCLSWLQNPKVRIAFVCITTFFNADVVMMYAMTVSDFVGKTVYGGDPRAAPVSDSVSRYQEGMKTASWALLLYFCTYLLSSILHPRILACLGFRAEFLFLQLLIVIAMVTVALTSRLEAVFVLSAVAGVHRTCSFSMPYAITNDIAQSIVSKGTGKSPVGLALSLVASCTPMSYCLLFAWVGAVEDLTGDVSAPLWLGTGFAFLSVVAFLFVGKV